MKKIACGIVSILFLFMSCDMNSLLGIDPRISDFSASSRTVEEGESVTFTITGSNKDETVSSSATDYGVKLTLTSQGETLWDKTLKSNDVQWSGFSEKATVFFNEAGVFDVVLKVEALGGVDSSVTETITITVEDKPAEYFDVYFYRNCTDFDITMPDTKSVMEGSTIDYELVSRDTYTFNGWYTTTTADAGTKWDFDTDVVTGTTILYASWSRAGDSMDNPKFVALSSSFTSQSIELNDGEEFWIKTYIGWNQTLAISRSNRPVNDINYTIYDSNGNALNNEQELEYSPSYTYSPNASGYVYIKLTFTYHMTNEVLDLILCDKPN